VFGPKLLTLELYLLDYQFTCLESGKYLKVRTEIDWKDKNGFAVQ